MLLILLAQEPGLKAMALLSLCPEGSTEGRVDFDCSKSWARAVLRS